MEDFEAEFKNPFWVDINFIWKVATGKPCFIRHVKQIAHSGNTRISKVFKKKWLITNRMADKWIIEKWLSYACGTGTLGLAFYAEG